MSFMNISAKLVTHTSPRRLTTKEENRLNEAAKIRIAKLLGVKRNMIDLTDDEHPQKVARIDHHRHMEARDTGLIPQNDLRRSSGSYNAPIQTNNHYVNPPMIQMQGPRVPIPQPTELARPADMLDHISLAVSSLETSQLRELLSTAALRHPDVLELLRTSFRIQETNKTSDHQALSDLLVAQSQEQARIVRAQKEYVRNDSVYTNRPYGPPANAPSERLVPYGGTAPVPAYGPAWSPAYHSAQVFQARPC